MLKATAFALFAALLGAEGAAAQTMTLTSPDIAPGTRIADEQVYKGFGCTGGNISPALSWSGAPKDTKSFALSVYDPDAPTGSGFLHWVVFNIPPDVTSLPKNAGDPKGPAAPKGGAEPHGFWRSRLRRPVSSPRRSAASLSFHDLRRRHAQARRGRKHDRRRRWLHASLPHARQGGADGRLGTLIERVDPHPRGAIKPRALAAPLKERAPS